jgi:hypothetical protein
MPFVLPQKLEFAALMLAIFRASAAGLAIAASRAHNDIDEMT